MQSKISFLLVLAQLCWTAAGIITPRLTNSEIGKIVNRKTLQPVRSSSYDTGATLQYIELPVNHLDANSETFLNRYWVDDYYYQEGGPVFFIDNGEASAEGMDQYLRDGASGSLAETFNGLLILWEHRFYGASMPNMTADMQFEPTHLEQYLKYHAIEQAMEDVVVFAKGFSYPGLPNVDLKPGNTPWVFVGGSYPGARAAWMRLRNPEVFHASLASSAVVELEEDFWEYYHIVETTMQNSGYSNCSADMRAVAAFLNDAFDNKNASAVDNFMNMISGPKGTPLYRYFHWDDLTAASSAWDNRMTNIRAAVQVMFQDFQYVGVDGYLGAFCDSLQAEATGRNNIATIRASAGIFADYDTDSALAVYADVLQSVWTEVLQPTDYPSVGQTSTSTDDQQYDCVSDPSTCQDIITQFSWTYQYCSEFGAFQVTNASRPSSLLPKIESVDNWVKDCVGYFGNSVSDGPNLAPINKKYGGWNMSPSNVMFTDGELDPWRAVSLHSIEDNSPKRTSTTNIPANGTTAGGNAFFGYVVSGGFHCPDLGNVVRLRNTSSINPIDNSGDTQTSANTAHTLFINALNVWLPAFVKHTVSNTPTITPTDVSNGGSNGSPKKKSAAANNMAPISSIFYSIFTFLIVYAVL